MRQLSEAQISEYVSRCPELTRWAFEGWLRGERSLDGDLIDRGDESRDGDRAGEGVAERRRVRSWLGEHLISDWTGDVDRADQLEGEMHNKPSKRRIANEPMSPETRSERDGQPRMGFRIRGANVRPTRLSAVRPDPAEPAPSLWGE